MADIDVGAPKSVNDLPNVTMYGYDFRKEVLAMHDAVTELKLWQKFGTSDPGKGGYAWSFEDHVRKVENHPKVVACGHSGMTQAYCMRVIQTIATKGWDAFVKEYAGASLNPIADFLAEGSTAKQAEPAAKQAEPAAKQAEPAAKQATKQAEPAAKRAKPAASPPGGAEV